ncbi:hypothetical protein Cs7R123_62630 [Catellatospora sp. TT07R-123]|uniref:peptidoglycan DD-metalloendopeptidase family protein n=1 Tax=Catellatospora sp. TT07R-123 TaxID=2733863 RepID=UPI001B283DE4|nr:peptidoglycan DD-metalloendopeptidase family protein [Catellatospora sp. TT07R-123]GHJ48921.1 hypothetical protein Cs7R123_62630 [Catellatospora sp. TT07R-123]
MDRRKLLLFTAAAVPAGMGLFGSARPAAAVPLGNPIAIAVEPIESGDAAYALLAPAKNGDPEAVKVVLRLNLTNTGTQDLKVSGIEFQFAGGYTQTMQGLDQLLVIKDPVANTDDGGVFTPGQTKTWTNGRITLPGNQVGFNQVYLPAPAPAWVTVRVFVAGYLFASEVTLPLVPYNRAHRFPLHASDLRPGEVLTTTGDHWANGGAGGTQIYAHDVGVVAWDGATWSKLLPGGDGTKNEHYRAWDLPVRAVADGTVLMCNDGTMPDNPAPGALPTPTPKPVGGNNVWVQHTDGTVTWYTHLRQGTMTVVPGQMVFAGMELGRLGDSGNASEPHIHLEARRDIPGDYPLRPMHFTEAWQIDKAAGSPWNPESPLWVPMNGRAIPNSEVLIWPEASAPAWYPPGKSEIVLYGIPAAKYQDTYNKLVKSGYRPEWIDAHEGTGERGGVFFNVIYRPQDGSVWQARHGMTSADYQAQFDGLDKEGFRLHNVTSYLSGTTVLYAAIWYKRSGPTMAAYHGKDAVWHQNQFDSLVKQGFHPVNISIVSPGNVPQITAFYVKEDVGTFDAPSFATSAEYQNAWNINGKLGRQLTYFSACQHAGGYRISAIFQDVAPGKGGTVGRHDLGEAKFSAELDLREKSDYLTRCLGGYTSGGTVLYGAGWRR